MATFKFYLLTSSSLIVVLFLLLFLLFVATRSHNSCTGNSCGNSYHGPLNIEFPFKIRDGQSDDKCGYPGFEVFCGRNTNNQTFINLPKTGDFVIGGIDYSDHKLWITNPHECIPKHYLLHGRKATLINLGGTPFSLSAEDLRMVHVAFYNCSNEDIHIKVREQYAFQKTLNCLNNGKTSVVVTAVDHSVNIPAPAVNLSKCRKISTASIQCSDMFDVTLPLLSAIPLKWNKPICDYPHCERDEKIRRYALGIGMMLAAGIICFSDVTSIIYSIKNKVNRNRDFTISEESDYDANQRHSLQPLLIPSPMVRTIDHV